MGGGAHTEAERGGACLSVFPPPTPQNGKTPLHFAAEKGHTSVVDLLLAAGADKDATDKVRGRGHDGKAGVEVQPATFRAIFASGCFLFFFVRL